ncbi:MAG: sugar phosphate isomerase/epimerase [Acidobacteria bacterium]|nr:MAG: sugar phosphate isomerase/epimerase [Acidobacteriota bacterium]
MNVRRLSRRSFVFAAAAIAGFAALSGRAFSRTPRASNRVHVASNEYSWTVFYARENRNFKQSLDAGLTDVAQSELNGLEPFCENPEEVDRIVPLLKRHGLEMRSLYVNSTLHEPDKADASIEQILAVARKAKAVGTRFIVTNPSPIRWAGPENKDDKQLRTQAAAVEKLGRELNRLGLKLAYHNHDMELRNGAREFHHMMVATDPALVSLCLDAHWIYRGTGNSSIALFDIVELYGSRVVEVHLRQSQSGTWSETFGEGDIDYARLAARLKAKRVKPHLVLEVAVEKGTPKTLDPVAAHRKSVEYVQRVFGGL